jgi:GDP-L-fucose synthase
MYELKGKRVWVAGHKGMLGSALMRRLASEGCVLLTSTGVDLRDQEEVLRWMWKVEPQAVFLAAGTVGGIVANDSRPGDFIYDNLMIGANVIHAAYQCGIEKLLYVGSSCIYPRDAHQPITEDALLTGPLEPTNQWYAIAKIAGVKLAQAYRLQYGCDFISAMPTNLYGPGDNFDLEIGHVIPALIRKAHEAKACNGMMSVWGSGKPRREFLHVDDCADALVFLMRNYSDLEPINVGYGGDISIEALAVMICETVGCLNGIFFDHSKPDGSPRKLLNSNRLSGMGWNPTVSLMEGIASTCQWALEHEPWTTPILSPVPQ